jgi:hypothetical protein
MENNIQTVRCGLKDKHPLIQKHLHPTTTETTVLQANPMRRAMRYRVILQAAASFLK